MATLITPWCEQWPTICRLVATAMTLSLMLLLPMFIYNSFQLSHRFVGPVTQLRQVLRDLAEGKPVSPLTFRKGDYWQEMAEELNRAVEVLRKERLAEESAAFGHNENGRSKDLEMAI